MLPTKKNLGYGRMLNFDKSQIEPVESVLLNLYPNCDIEVATTFKYNQIYLFFITEVNFHPVWFIHHHCHHQQP